MLKKTIMSLMIALTMTLGSLGVVFAQEDLSQGGEDYSLDGVMGSGEEATSGLSPKSRSLTPKGGDGYNLTWTIRNGNKTMLDYNGNAFSSAPCEKVIDVSSYNGAVDWSKIKSGGTDGAILRITSHAGGWHQDDQFANNVKGCKENAVPFGGYLYGYARNTAEATNEANLVITYLRNNGVKPTDMKYPVYYDMEANGYVNGLSAAQNAENWNAFKNRLQSAGYANVKVYSYVSYLKSNLNTPEIMKYVSWVARYGQTFGWTNSLYTGDIGWQYQSNGSVPGVNGEVDVSVFTNGCSQTSSGIGVKNNAMNVKYKAQVQTVGWLSDVYNGATQGTVGQSKRMETINMSLTNKPVAGGLEYRAHVQGIGWQNWVSEGQDAGTVGQSKRVEAIQVRLTGELANQYDVQYRVHAQNIGWMGWAKNGEKSGTATYSYRLEGIEVYVLKKGEALPDFAKNYQGTSAPYNTRVLRYKTHVQTYGWQGDVYDGALSGTTGQSKRLEGIVMSLNDAPYEGGIEYKTHVQTYGWQNWEANGLMAGTSGQSKRLEGIQIRLTGEMANHYNIEYRTHVQDYGWEKSWSRNGAISGTTGQSKRLEGIQVRLVAK